MYAKLPRDEKGKFKAVLPFEPAPVDASPSVAGVLVVAAASAVSFALGAAMFKLIRKGVEK